MNMSSKTIIYLTNEVISNRCWKVNMTVNTRLAPDLYTAEIETEMGVFLLEYNELGASLKISIPNTSDTLRAAVGFETNTTTCVIPKTYEGTFVVDILNAWVNTLA